MLDTDILEYWKSFPLDARYEVSILGRVRRVSSGKIRKTPIKQNGYPGLVLTYPNGRPVGFDLHFMVAVTWLGPRPPGFDISHQDGNKLNNSVINLKYESRKENSNKNFNKFSKLGGTRFLTLDLVQKIRADTVLSNTEWAKKLGVKRTTIWKVRTRLTWKHC